MNKARKTRNDAERELRRLTYLVRFALDQINRKSHTAKGQDLCCDIIKDVTYEFRPYIQVAHLSGIVAKKLNLFYHTFLKNETVTHYLWIIVNEFMTQLDNELTVPDFIHMCRDLFVPLVEVEHMMQYDSERLEVIVKIEDFLNDPKVRQFNIAVRNVEKRMENLLVGADESRIIQRHDSGCDYFSPRRLDSQYLGDEALDVNSAELAACLDVIAACGGNIPSTSRPPFFQNFDDFISFDIDLKHKLPISISEFAFLYEKESESLTAPGWELAVDKRMIKILKFNPETAGSNSRTDMGTSVLVRAYARLPNTDSRNIFYNIYDAKKRQSWDTNFSDITVLNDSECEILYCQLASPFGVTPRDFLQYRKAVIDTDCISIMMRSADHDSRPVKSGFIRAESFISGYIIRQRGPDCELFIMSQTDIKGLIPKWIVNMVAAKAPAQWVDNLLRACGKIKDSDKFLTDYVSQNTVPAREEVMTA